MPNDKTHLYGRDDYEKDQKGTGKRKTQQGFSRFSVSQTQSINTANETATSPAVQITTKPQIGEPVDDSLGAVNSPTSIAFNVPGSRHTILSIIGDTPLTFDILPQGRWIDFSLDMVINTATPPTITLDPRVVNPPALPVFAQNDRVFLHFIGVKDDTSTRFYFLSGVLNGDSIGGGGGGSNGSIKAVMEVPQGQDAYPDIVEFSGIGGNRRLSGFVMPAAIDSLVNCKVEVPSDLTAVPSAKVRFQWINLGTGGIDMDSLIVTVRRLVVGPGDAVTGTLVEEPLQQVIVSQTINTKGGTEISLTSTPNSGDSVIFQLFRKGTSALDTYPGDILVYTTDLVIG